MDCSESASVASDPWRMTRAPYSLLESMKVSDNHQPEDAFSVMEPEAQHLTPMKFIR